MKNSLKAEVTPGNGSAGNADSLQAVIDRVRRSTRNGDVITLCDELQRRMVGQSLIDAARGRDVEPAKPLSRAAIQKNYRQRKKQRGDK
jgi:hypothetical protein